MSSNTKGFSTLNRWFGKKNKDKSGPNGKLSKSSTNLSLSISTTNINETSQLEYNRITPLPAATSNAPFEQTFRITVLLPKDQLYVTRLGARVPLSKLLELVSENKQLDRQKYEFRNPVDPSQVYNCDLTIGAVGLSEVRLCLKTDPYDTFNTDEVLKLHRTSVRDSLSSSEFSSRNSKHTTKTASPYSSNNSLNSMDSTGMNYTRTPVTAPPTLPATAQPKMTAPPRKKRAAPRPPSQFVIPEKSALVIENVPSTPEMPKATLKAATLPRKDFYVSTPNLPTTVEQNNNNNNNNRNSMIANGHGYETQSSLEEENNARNLCGGSVQNLSEQSEPKLPEPSPRKRIVQIKKKAAPAPPPRDSNYNEEDSVSLASNEPHTPHVEANGNAQPEAIQMPTPATRETTVSASTPVAVAPPESPKLPQPVPRMTTTTLLNAEPEKSFVCPAEPEEKVETPPANVSKVMLNRTPTPEPRSLSFDPPDGSSRLDSHMSDLSNGALCTDEDDNVSKQADSGIGEPVPSPIPDSLPSEGSAHECKSTFESSSDDDDIIKVYNFKLGKTLAKPIAEHKTLEDLSNLTAQDSDASELTSAGPSTQATTPVISETTSWNFQIPISPPPNFADSEKQTAPAQLETTPDTPITPKIKERPVLDFESLQKEESFDQTTAKAAKGGVRQPPPPPKRAEVTPLPSPATPIDEILNELSAVINENRMDSLIKRADHGREIESAKPNTLANFSIATISHQNARPTEVVAPSNGSAAAAPPLPPQDSSEDEKIYRKRGTITNGGNFQKQRRSVTRADSFHATSGQSPPSSRSEASPDTEPGLNGRSSSYLSLTKIDQNGFSLNRRRSSSELSIGESPSLQSPEVIKTILNSRKNSLEGGSDGGAKEQRALPTTESAEKPKIEVAATPRVAEKRETVQLREVPPANAPRVYKYSGPPSINFSTWSERPKVQVLGIKNEGDYIIGSKSTERATAEDHTKSLPHNYRATAPAKAFNPEWKIEPAKPTPAVAPPANLSPASPTKRMGIPDHEYRVPITVRPLRDVTVDNVQPRPKEAPRHAATQVTVNNEWQSMNGAKAAEPASKRPVTLAFASSTLPRSNASAPGPALLRAAGGFGGAQFEAAKAKSSEAEDKPPSAPFGQNTLRRTGLKEKILAQEETAQKPRIATINAQSPKITKASVTITNGSAPVPPKPAKTLHSATLELKLQRSTSVFVNQAPPAVPAKPLKPTTPQSAPVAPPAPPPMLLKSVSLRPRSAATTPTNGGDPRDQLLAAIRNFKRDELNRS